MRDLQAYPELCNKATVIKMALAEKERADKAEKLSKMLSDYDKWLSAKLVASAKRVDSESAVNRYAAQRIERLESLNRELVEALDIAVKELLFAGAFEVVVDRRITRVIIKALFKAKEVLGHDS